MPELELRTTLRADAARQRILQRSRFGYSSMTWWLDPGFVCVLLFRLSHSAQRLGHGKTARLLMQANSVLTGADFHPASRLGPGLLVPSPCSTNLSCAAGRNLVLMPQAGIGGSLSTVDIGAGPGLPLLGDDVRVGQFAGVNGPFNIGDRVRVAGGAGAIRSVAADRLSRAASTPLLSDLSMEPVATSVVRPSCSHADWRSTMADWRCDLARLAAEQERYDGQPVTRGRWISVATTNPMLAMLAQRIAHWLMLNGRRRLAAVLVAGNRLVHKLSMPATTCVGGGLLVPHLAGLVVEGTLGRNVTLYANTVCGGGNGGPVIGDGVIVGGHAGVIGSVRCGNAVRLAPKVQMLADVDDGCEAFSPMARVCDEPFAPPVPVAVVRSLLPVSSVHAAIAGDRARAAAPGLAGRVAVRLHRWSSACHATGHLRFARLFWLANVYLTGADISPASRIGPGLLIPFPAGIAFHGQAGVGLTMGAMSGVGADLDDTGGLAPLAVAPLLGEHVRLDCHALVLGPSTIGNGVRIMPGCTAAQDIAAGITVMPRSLRLRRPTAPATVARR